ncbi:MAG: DUF1684 domain-containing protein [Candidatus Promineifilaceae bacterium]
MNEHIFSAEMETWQAQRLASLRSPNGFLSLVGLCWLQMGVNQLGSADANSCIFPAGLPDRIGTLTVSETAMQLTIADGVHATHKGAPIDSLTLYADSDPNGPTIIEHGSVSWFVIKRGDALGIRIRDTDSALLQRFAGVDRFPEDVAWRISAEFQPHLTPHTVPIPTILGTNADMLSPGVVKLSYQGHTQTLTALSSADSKRLFLIIADKTTGQDSYGGGRFLTTEAIDENNQVLIDFNKATNPPCAFSPYATCPRPPAENRLPFAILAGEKTFHY